MSLLGKVASRAELGLPSDWRRIEKWLNFSGTLQPEENEVQTTHKSKWENIPILMDYSKPPTTEFWKFLPSRSLPSEPETKVNVKKLEEKIGQYSSQSTCHQMERALKAVD
jgi:hypothetical protein